MLIATHVGMYLVLVSAANILVSCCDNSAVIPAISLHTISSVLMHNNKTSEDIRSGSETPINTQDIISEKVRPQNTFSNLSKPGNDYIHFPYSAEQC